MISGEKQYHVIEIMACPGGCIGGGGQPYPSHGYNILDPALAAKRASALYSIDKSKTLRRSHDNPAVKKLYEEFLGATGSEMAHKLLHTHYHPRTRKGIR
jgi:iron only hydrogenase large subunit-like protein